MYILSLFHHCLSLCKYLSLYLLGGSIPNDFLLPIKYLRYVNTFCYFRQLILFTFFKLFIIKITNHFFISFVFILQNLNLNLNSRLNINFRTFLFEIN